MFTHLITKKIKNISGFIIVLLSLSAGNASAALLDAFANGGFEGYAGNTNSFNSAVPPGWTTTAGTPDVFDGNTNIYGMTWQSSSTGGDFLHGIGWDGRSSPYVESALQIGLDGLVIGQDYEISFEQSISYNAGGGQVDGYWEIVFGSESQIGDILSAPASGVAAPWVWQTMIFTATSTIQTLEVIAHSAHDTLRADLGIVSFFLGDPNTNPDNPDTTPDEPDEPTTSVPAPGTLALLGLGFVLLGYRSRRHQRG